MVRSRLKKHRRARLPGLSDLCPQGEHAPRHPAMGSQVPALWDDNLLGVRSRLPAHRAVLAAGSLLPAPLQCCQQPQGQARAGVGSCQEQEDSAGKERGFQGQALS